MITVNITISIKISVLKLSLPSRLFANVSGSTLTIVCNNGGKLLSGKNVPQKKVIGIMMKFITEDSASGFFIHKPIAIPSRPKQTAESSMPIIPAKLSIGTSKNSMAII